MDDALIHGQWIDNPSQEGLTSLYEVRPNWVPYIGQYMVCPRRHDRNSTVTDLSWSAIVGFRPILIDG